MNRTGIALLSAAALLAAGSATAGEMDGGADISWTYGQIGYVKADGDDFQEVDGYSVAGSIALAKNWHAGAAYESLSSDSDYFSDNVDADYWALSVGYNAGLAKNSQAYFDIGYFDVDVDGDYIDGAEGDSSGIQLTAGLRYQPAPKVELGAAVTYTNGEVDGGTYFVDYDYNDTSLALSGQYFFTPAFSLGANVTLNGGIGVGYGGSSTDVFRLFLRYSFGGPLSDAS